MESCGKATQKEAIRPAVSLPCTRDLANTTHCSAKQMTFNDTYFMKISGNLFEFIISAFCLRKSKVDAETD